MAIIDRLIEAGVNAEKTIDGRFILAAAARNKRLKGIIPRLVASGADVNRVDPFWAGTALHVALDAENASAVTELVAAGADPEIKAPPSKASWSQLTASEFARQSKKKLLKLLENAGRASTPQVAGNLSSVDEIWNRLEKYLERHDAKMLRSLFEEAKPKDLKALGTILGETLPSEVLQFYGRHDGQKKGCSLIPPLSHSEKPYRLMTVAEGIKELKEMNELLAGGNFDDLEVQPDSGVRANWWNTKWFPFASNGLGDLLCIDFSPVKGDSRAQIIAFFHENGQRPRLGASFQEYLNTLMHSLVEE